MKEVLSIGVLALTIGLGCGDDDGGAVDATAGGPIDGEWSLTGTFCDGQTAQFPPYVLDVRGDAGTFTFTFASDCVAAFDEAYSYADDTITITPQSVACDPDAGCMDAIGASCPAVPPPLTYRYALVGTTLEFTKTSAGPPIDPCPVGQEVKFTME